MARGLQQLWQQAICKTPDVFQIALKFSKKLTGNTEEPPRWRKCVSAASGSLGKSSSLLNSLGAAVLRIRIRAEQH